MDSLNFKDLARRAVSDKLLRVLHFILSLDVPQWFMIFLIKSLPMVLPQVCGQVLKYSRV